MSNFLFESINLTNEIIKDIGINEADFYNSVLLKISSLYKESLLAVYFLENTSYSFKAGIKNQKKIKSCDVFLPEIDSFLNSDSNFISLKTKQNEFLNKNTLLVKLAIKDSVFGFLIFSINEEISKEKLEAFISISNIISYKIKDFELQDVFKLQLKALQEAIIEKQNAYEIIKKQHKKLQELDKTKNLFLANISHDLRTPLNAIIGFSQALDSKIFGELNEKQSEYIKDIQISGLHLLGMINEILDISKLEAHVMKFMPIELKPEQVIQEVINILEPLYKNKKIEIVFENEFSGSIKADYQKFQQILFNLLSNAIKFTNDEGKVVVTSSQENKNYILKVKDNGIGIDKKNHSKIFKKFVHLNNVYTKNSTGLGLTITKELVKLHNGKISLVSELNKGTTFTMEFKNIIV